MSDGSEISIHALREEGDRPTTIERCLDWIFLSTPSARRATNQRAILDSVAKFLSTPSARRATWVTPEELKEYTISIHALREEGDRRRLAVNPEYMQISIHALREEGDRVVQTGLQGVFISIHALREEGD